MMTSLPCLRNQILCLITIDFCSHSDCLTKFLASDDQNSHLTVRLMGIKQKKEIIDHCHHSILVHFLMFYTPVSSVNLG